MAEEVRSAATQLTLAPQSRSLWPDLSGAVPVRRLVLKRFPFALAYLVQGDRVVILAVAHTSREPMYWIHRLPKH